MQDLSTTWREELACLAIPREKNGAYGWNHESGSMNGEGDGKGVVHELCTKDLSRACTIVRYLEVQNYEFTQYLVYSRAPMVSFFAMLSIISHARKLCFANAPAPAEESSMRPAPCLAGAPPAASHQETMSIQS